MGLWPCSLRSRDRSEESRADPAPASPPASNCIRRRLFRLTSLRASAEVVSSAIDQLPATRDCLLLIRPAAGQHSPDEVAPIMKHPERDIECVTSLLQPPSSSASPRQSRTHRFQASSRTVLKQRMRSCTSSWPHLTKAFPSRSRLGSVRYRHPSFKKAAFVFGGEYGQGVGTCRTATRLECARLRPDGRCQLRLPDRRPVHRSRLDRQNSRKSRAPLERQGQIRRRCFRSGGPCRTECTGHLKPPSEAASVAVGPAWMARDRRALPRRPG